MNRRCGRRWIVKRYTLRLLSADRPAQAEVDRRDWEEPAEVSERAWKETASRFGESHQKMYEAMKTSEKIDRLIYHVPHEGYHIGQIMYLRALQGFPPIE